jgi:hypothetical protein
MMHRIAASAATLCLCLPTWGQYMQLDGSYTSPVLEVRVLLLDDERGVAAASATVVSGACSGTVAGTGQVRGRTLTITPYKKIEGGESCRLELEFDASWKQVKAMGRDCRMFSGAACGFEGQTARKTK